MALASCASGAIARSATQANDLEPLAAWEAGKARMQRAGRLNGSGIGLPARAHQVAADPRRSDRAWAAARRPGEWLWRLDLAQGCVAAATAVDDSRRFEGHVLPWLDDGQQVARLFDSETCTDDGQGRIAVRDPDTLALLDEWMSEGVGPHALLRWEEEGLVVANGGLLLLPETGRLVRNADAVQSSVVLLDARSGRAREKWDAPLPGVSLRHLARSGDGVLGVAMQAASASGLSQGPVLAFKPPGSSTLMLAEASDALLKRLRGYAGGIAAAGNSFAVTCPRADRVVVWSSQGRLQAEFRIPGAWGVCACGSGWRVTGSGGSVFEIDATVSSCRLLRRVAGRVWDNHLG